jgi:hypothetical protein
MMVTENLALGRGMAARSKGKWVRSREWPWTQFGGNDDNPAGAFNPNGRGSKPKEQKRRESPRAVVTNQIAWCQPEAYAKA